MSALISSVLLLWVLTAALCPVYEAEGVSVPNCHLYVQRPGCARHLRPVCGTDGNTYPNECMLCASNRDNGLSVQIKWNGGC